MGILPQRNKSLFYFVAKQKRLGIHNYEIYIYIIASYQVQGSNNYSV